MNYLAHLYFADGTDASIVGNLLPDFVRGATKRISAKYGLDVMAGFFCHRFVDAFTDTHAAFITSKRRLDPALGLLRGVVVDVAYDHLLATQWSQYHDTPLSVFTTQCYDALERSIALLPERLQRGLPFWRELDLLGSYASLDGIHVALERIADRVERRTGRRFDLAGELRTFEAQRESFVADFARFFPALIKARAMKDFSHAGSVG